MPSGSDGRSVTSHAKRLNLSPIAPEALQTLKDMGYVEIVDDEPVITLSGMDEMNLGD